MIKECVHCGSDKGVLCVERKRKWFFFLRSTKHKCLDCGYIIEYDYSILRKEKEYHGGE